MKKLFIAGLVLLTSVIAQAQIVSSSSRSIITQAVERNTVIYLKGGLAFQTWTGKDVDEYLSVNGKGPGNGVGYDALLGFQKDISLLNGLYWGSEVGIGSRGMKISASEGSEKATITAMMHALKATPAQIGFKYDINNRLTIDGHLGLMMSVDLFGGLNYKYVNGDVSESESMKISEMDGYKRFDIGINPGITLWLGKLGIDFTYQKGFVSMAGSDANVFGQNLLLRLAYRF